MLGFVNLGVNWQLPPIVYPAKCFNKEGPGDTSLADHAMWARRSPKTPRTDARIAKLYSQFPKPSNLLGLTFCGEQKRDLVRRSWMAGSDMHLHPMRPLRICIFSTVRRRMRRGFHWLAIKLTDTTTQRRKRHKKSLVT